jgi:predicted component of type VI protein secretion system
VLLGSILLLAGGISLCGYVCVRKKKEKSPESWEKKENSMVFDTSRDVEPEDLYTKQKTAEDAKDGTGDLEKSPKAPPKHYKRETQREYPGENQKKIPNDYGETVVLCEKPVAGPASLVSREPGELATIYLNEDLTVIGKLETAADAVIDMPTVSRLHAKIRRKDGEYFLTDLNSKNGTSVNGKMLKGDEAYQLQDEDEVDFAQARYIFLK